PSRSKVMAEMPDPSQSNVYGKIVYSYMGHQTIELSVHKLLTAHAQSEFGTPRNWGVSNRIEWLANTRTHINLIFDIILNSKYFAIVFCQCRLFKIIAKSRVNDSVFV